MAERGEAVNVVEMQNRVGAWLRNAGWYGEGGSRPGTMADMWREAVLRHDASSPPAIGCLVAIVREANDDPFAQTIHEGTGWRMVGRLDYAGLYGFDTEIEALVAALEAAS